MLNMIALRTLPVRFTSAYLRMFHWDIARWRLVKYAIRQTRAYGSLMGKATVKTHFGFKMELQLHDWGDQHIYATGSYEELTARTIATLLGPGDACVDVGANIGFFTLLMAKRVGPQGSVWAFEPSPLTRQRLIRNITLNNMMHVTVREEAVADIDGTRLFFDGPREHSGLGTLRPAPSCHASYEVRTCRLTNCIPSSMRPRLIKMDIEGAEHLAFQGMTELLRDQHPDIIVEMADHYLREMGSSSAELYAFLKQLGYNMHRIDWDGLIGYQRWDPSLPREFNALFTLKERLPSQLILKSIVV